MRIIMKLGNFSISLNVKDIHISKTFYENLGFTFFGGEISQNWFIMKNGTCTIDLFQAIFDKNLMAFNPGWSANAKPLKTFTGIRDLQCELKSKNIKFQTEADEKTSDPASFTVIDPDGNPILFDQHV